MQRNSVLESEGWEVLRILTITWFQNPSGTLRTVDKAREAARIERRLLFAYAHAKTPLNRLRNLAAPLLNPFIGGVFLSWVLQYRAEHHRGVGRDFHANEAGAEPCLIAGKDIFQSFIIHQL